MNHTLFKRWQANFWAGLVIVLPGVVSVVALLWLFGTIANLTDLLLFFLPRGLTHRDQGNGPMHWYWSLMALGLAVLLIASIGRLARNYFGKRMIEWIDSALLKIPLLNKIYGATKQVNDAFSSTGKTAFRTVVLVEYPCPGSWSVAFVTNDQPEAMQAKIGRKLVCVFMPTTPNPTTGFLLLVPPEKTVKLDLSIADGIKYIISLGAVIPDPSAGRRGIPPPAAAEPSAHA